MRLRLSGPVLALAALALLAFAAAACGGSSQSPGDTAIATPSAADIVPILVSHELTVGENRFVVGLQDPDNKLILNAVVHLRFFSLKGGRETLKGEADTHPIVVQEGTEDMQGGGTPHLESGGQVGVYVASVSFDETGLWAVEVDATVQGRVKKAARAQFEVFEKGSTPAVGDPAPRSVQTTLRDVKDISGIDSSSPPRTAMHVMTIAEAIDSGRPTVVAFATPAFCRSRVCGPVMDAVMDPLFQRYGDRVNFIHVEPYVLDRARQGDMEVVPTVKEWGLETEPWVFVIDRQGRIAAKFEGIMSVDEVEPVIQQVLGE